MPKNTKKDKAASEAGALLRELDGRHVPSLARARGTIRFDISDDGRTQYTRVTLDRGRISVSRGRGAADCIVRTDKSVFAELATGEANPLTAVLRGVLSFEGDAELLVLFRRALVELGDA